jgi:two-component system chemotaxis response regulator CheB
MAHARAAPLSDEPVLPVVALVASSGGIAALTEVLGALPQSLAAAVVVLQHLQAGRHSYLPEILGGRTRLPVCEAVDGAVLRAGTVYVAPSGRHLRIAAGGTLALTDTPPIHFSRPSADVLLDSLAEAGVPMVAVVLTGKGRDGAAGSLRVHLAGGTVLAQDRATSLHFGMPGAAAGTGGVDQALPLEAIAPRIVELIENLHAPPG